MSLDVYLESDTETTKNCCWCECGHKHEHCFPKILFHGNITNNLIPMADALGIYFIIWRPDENGIIKAKELTKELGLAIDELFDKPHKYKKLECENGWGTVFEFVRFLTEYLGACLMFPDANIKVSR